jgi:chemotaxis protein MotB
VNRKALLPFIFAALLLTGCVSSKQYRMSQDELAKCRTDQSMLQQQVDSLNTDKANLAQTAAQKDEEINKLKGTYDQLVGGLKNEIANGQIQVTQLRDKLTVNMVDKILFDSGRSDIKPTGMEVLGRIGDVLKKVADKDIRVEGHTDNVPVGSRLRQRYPTNWELSTARATNVVRFLQEKGGVDPTRLIAAGYSEYHPVSSNDTEEGQADNRRIDIVLIARETTPSGEQPAGQPAKAAAPAAPQAAPAAEAEPAPAAQP